MSEDICLNMVAPDGWHYRPCGRKVKDDGMCALHLAGARRSAKAESERRAKDNRSARAGDTALSALKRLCVKGSPEISTATLAYTGRVVLTVRELERITAPPND